MAVLFVAEEKILQFVFHSHSLLFGLIAVSVAVSVVQNIQNYLNCRAEKQKSKSTPRSVGGWMDRLRHAAEDVGLPRERSSAVQPLERSS